MKTRTFNVTSITKDGSLKLTFLVDYYRPPRKHFSTNLDTENAQRRMQVLQQSLSMLILLPTLTLLRCTMGIRILL